MQTRRGSAIEAVTNVAVGFVVAVAGQYAIFPIFGLQATHSEHMAIGAFFTVVSLARSYALRRVFNWWHA